MKRVLWVTCLFAGFMIAATDSGKIPGARITNGMIRAGLYLPDPVNGYYRATRFEWSGVMSSLEFKGHSYFGQWFTQYSPDIHDAIMGPVEEFTPVGFDESGTGSAFLKPGVGMLVKADESPYSSFRLYRITNPGTWTSVKKKDQVDFVHVLKDEGYSYEYRKTVQLVRNKAELVLVHTLKNTGRKSIETSVYDHNFFMIDNMPTGPAFRVSFPFKAGGTFQGPPEIVTFRDNQMNFTRELTNKENIYCGGLTGVGDSPKDYDIRIDNLKTGAGVRITGDRPLSKLVFWACRTTLCPEPYIHISIEPGQEFSWTLTYEFYISDQGH